MVEIVENTVELDGCVLKTLEAGSGERGTVVLLHGRKFRAQTWQELGTIDFLASLGYRVVGVDMPGFGGSPACDIPHDRVLQGCLRRMGLSDVVLVGPSMGGRTVLEYAINCGESLKAMIVVGPVGVEENREKLSGIQVPVLAVWGENDTVSPLAMSDILVDEIPDARKVVLAGAPHPCYLDQPENWHAALETFLQSIEKYEQ